MKSSRLPRPDRKKDQPQKDRPKPKSPEAPK